MKKHFVAGFSFLTLVVAIGMNGCSSSTSNNSPFSTPTWTTGNFGSTATILGICFPTSSIAYACGFNGTILKSTDGGTTWTAQNSNTKENLYRISFKDALNGFVGGNNGAILGTSDGGTTWTSFSFGLFGSVNIRDVLYDASGHVLVAGGDQGVGTTFISSKDGTGIWNTVGGSSSFYSIASMHDPANNAYAVVGSGGLSLTTSDLGKTWNFSPVITADFLGVDFIDSKNGFGVTEEGKFTKSTDGGTTWNLGSNSVISGSLRTVKMLSTSEVWAAGANGNLAHTTNGGSSWAVSIQGGFTGSWNQIVQKDAHTWAFVGDNGTLFWLSE